MRTSPTSMERGTLKVEIPFTDHAHCIGRQGNQIQSIMSTTDTHIHFPDGNREPNGTKSNQVSISGAIGSIDQARTRIREILPMSLKFLIPPSHLIHLINDDYPLFKNVRSRFGVLVLPRPYAKTGDVYCIVRGLINQTSLIEATEHLLQVFYGFEASLVKVTCQIEVSEQYHIYLQTRQPSKEMCIAAIEQYTHTSIQFPMNHLADEQTMINNSSNGNGRRTSVTITGSPAQVCQARKLFDLCLPIILTFEIPTEREPTRVLIAQVKELFNVTAIVRARKDKIAKLVTLQTQEYNSEQLFRARSMILGLADMIHDSTLPTMTMRNKTVVESSTRLDLLKRSKDSLRELIDPTMTYASDLSASPCISSIQPISTPNLLIPIDSYSMPTPKRPSPIGHERSACRNLDQDTRVWPTKMESFSSGDAIDRSAPLAPASKLHSLLRSMNLDKYWPIFERHEIEYFKFLSMTEADLKDIGIETFGARRRMHQAIKDQFLANIPRYQ